MVAALCLVVVTSCGTSQVPDTAPQRAAPSESTTLEGTVRAGVEAGCLVVRVDGDTYHLVGAPAETLAPGDRVRLVGRTAPDLATSCMQGVPFQVRTSEILP